MKTNHKLSTERRKPKKGEKDCFCCKHFVEDCHNHGSLISGWCNIDNNHTSDWYICDLFEEQEDTLGIFKRNEVQEIEFTEDMII